MKPVTIPVTKPFMPPQEIYLDYIRQVHASGHWTNNGPLVQEFEKRITDYTGVGYFNYTANGTIALQLALETLQSQGEVITTPFSFVATLSSLVWEGLTPVFVDIDAETLNIDTNLIEAAITDRTIAILATHVYGNPCDISAIQALADKYGLKVIYDAAHCFGTRYEGQSIFNYGDISITSFHATKLFHTIEGGGIFTNDEALAARMQATREFGQQGQQGYVLAGINGKNSEVHAAMGLSILPCIDSILARRAEIADSYDRHLSDSDLQRPRVVAGADINHAYYPVIFRDEQQLLNAVSRLAGIGVTPRRYFSPSLNTLPYVTYNPAPVSEDISTRILCLPSYHELDTDTVQNIADIVMNANRC